MRLERGRRGPKNLSLGLREQFRLSHVCQEMFLEATQVLFEGRLPWGIPLSDTDEGALGAILAQLALAPPKMIASTIEFVGHRGVVEAVVVTSGESIT